jgi:hypothetical protein
MTVAAPQHHPDPATGQDRGDPPPARDLIDFHLRWREFRPLALQVLSRRGLSLAERDTLQALVDLADRVRDNDLLA